MTTKIDDGPVNQVILYLPYIPGKRDSIWRAMDRAMKVS
jgi:hypothetical protein